MLVDDEEDIIVKSKIKRVKYKKVCFQVSRIFCIKTFFNLSARFMKNQRLRIQGRA